jgi:hypothetical protein
MSTIKQIVAGTTTTVIMSVALYFLFTDPMVLVDAGIILFGSIIFVGAPFLVYVFVLRLLGE